MPLPAHWDLSQLPERPRRPRNVPLTPEQRARYREKQLARSREKRRQAGRGTPGLCECCGDHANKRHWDHDHATGLFRGYLCHRCNCALAFAKDSPDRLRALIAYLGRPEIQK